MKICYSILSFSQDARPWAFLGTQMKEESTIEHGNVIWVSRLLSLSLQRFMKYFSLQASISPWSQRFTSLLLHSDYTFTVLDGLSLRILEERTDKEKPLGLVLSSAASKFRHWYWPLRTYSSTAHQMTFLTSASRLRRHWLRTIYSTANTHGKLHLASSTVTYHSSCMWHQCHTYSSGSQIALHADDGYRYF